MGIHGMWWNGMGYRVFSQMRVPLSRELAGLTRIIHERFCYKRKLSGERQGARG
jgi:hypothetical protein